jgi:pimeloyl-ACP methyl ester carboxylesterase
MRENAVVFGEDSPLVGVVTQPDAGFNERAPLFLFLNAGAGHRVGPNRLNVTLARSLAKVGVGSMRFDFSGLGDSPVSGSLAETEERSTGEAIQAMNFLQRSTGVDKFVPVGVCSGANVGFMLATTDNRVAGGVLINASVIPSKHTAEQSSEAWKRAQVYHHRNKLLDWKGWTRVLTGQSDLPGVTRSAVRLARRALRLKEPRPRTIDLGLLPDLDRRGIELLAVYSQGDTGLELLLSHVGRFENVASLERFQLEILSDTDHILTPLWAQRQIEAMVLDWAARRLSLGPESTYQPDAFSSKRQKAAL